MNLKKVLKAALSAAAAALLFTASIVPAFAAGNDLNEAAKTYLTGDASGSSAASKFADGTSRFVKAEQVNENFDTYTFLDIRIDDLYNAGHIAGSYHIVYGTALADEFRYIPLDKPIVVVSNDGQLGWQVTGALNVIFANEGIDTKVLSWQGGYTAEGVDASKISTEAVALPTEANALSDEGNALLADYVGGLAEAKFANFIVSEEDTWNIINEIHNGNKEYTDRYIVVLLPAFGGTYVGEFNDSIFRCDYGGTEGAATLTGLDRSKIILVACGSGQTSDNTVGALRIAGYDAYSVRGGWGGNKGEISGDTKTGGINAYDAAQVAAGKSALFQENVPESIQNPKNWKPLVIAAAVIVVAAAVLIPVVVSKKKKAKKA
ncbi:MAG: rhodanese-like domain-containing protein [Eubacteriales bacterium]|nr:rhodanese-like domain-containing protein [Eubacteriales bacterium]